MAAPEDGKANDAVLRLLASVLDLPKHAVVLAAGHGSRDKSVVLSGITLDEAEVRLAAASGSRGPSTRPGRRSRR